MRMIINLLGVSIAVCCLVVAGCGGSKEPTPPVADEHGEHDHAEGDHDHHDHHDHPDGDHDHPDGDHDHPDGDHDHHDHAATTVDAEAAGLSTDDLVSLDKPDVPDNYDDAVKQLVELRNTIRDAFKADDADAAHGPLHEIGNLLSGIETLVKQSPDDAEHKKQMAAAVEELFDSYTAVDETFHSDGGKQYSEVESKIDAAVKTLQDHIGHGKN